MNKRLPTVARRHLLFPYSEWCLNVLGRREGQVQRATCLALNSLGLLGLVCLLVAAQWESSYGVVADNARSASIGLVPVHPAPVQNRVADGPVPTRAEKRPHVQRGTVVLEKTDAARHIKVSTQSHG